MMLNLDYEELLHLFDQSGLMVPPDLPGFTDLVNEEERAAALQAGASRFRGRGLDAADPQLQAVVRPATIIQINRKAFKQPDQWQHFYSNNAAITCLEPAGDNNYRLSKMESVADVIMAIETFLPLQPAPPELIYSITVNHEDYEALRELASMWEEIPSLEILEAEGLELIAARDLFDSAVEPQWRGILEFIQVDGEDITNKHTIHALQGPEVAWLVSPYPADTSRMLIETAQAGELRQALENSWRLITSHLSND